MNVMKYKSFSLGISLLLFFSLLSFGFQEITLKSINGKNKISGKYIKQSSSTVTIEINEESKEIPFSKLSPETINELKVLNSDKGEKNQSSKNDTSNLLNRIRVLEEDNARLRKRVIKLELELKSSASIPSVDKSKESTLKNDVALTHWITTSSGIRHNSSCRYFKSSKGRMCPSTAGRACKKCGG